MDNAVILSEGAFGTIDGKTGNGLVRYTTRYKVSSVIDSTRAGKDSGQVLSGRRNGIPIVSTVVEGVEKGANTLIIGVATDGGFLPLNYRSYVSEALQRGMNVVSGLHEFLSDDPEFKAIAEKSGSNIVDVRKIFLNWKYMFTGKIFNVESFRIAVLGTDSAIGKRTTAVIVANNFKKKGVNAVMLGTGQTAWMQGFKHTTVLDSMINDFVPGGLEKIAVDAWEEEHPEVMVVEGQGSVLHPVYPGSFEIIGAIRPDAIILQHAPKRKYFDGFPSMKIPDLEKYIKILELLSEKKVIAISLNSEGMTRSEVREEIANLENRFGIPVFDPFDFTPSLIQEMYAH
ncbi:MAG: DUF1611 domain-containing protein [Thermoplasmatales archaeon]|nr:DUF1611 domain-containing protein [Thermoplasmatales archaeon]MCW6169732.1 DUF1611 domain-containing protein [Thermoplasmatales archaeon]